MTQPAATTTEPVPGAGHWLGRGLSAATAALLRVSPLVVLLALAGAVAAGWYTVRHLGINTDTTDMISADLDWRQDFIEFREAFPILWRSLVVVIDGDSADLAEAARGDLLEVIRHRNDLFVLPEGESTETFFAREGLLYQSTQELAQLASRLAEIQPFLGRLARDPTLRGFADMFTLVARAREEGGDLDATPLLRELQRALDAVDEDRFHRFPWLELMDGDGEIDAADRRRLILLQPRLDSSRVAPAAEAIQFLYETADRLQLDPGHGVTIRLTGPVALEYEELRSVSRGAEVAAVLTLVLVLAVLLWGLRSIVLVGAALVTLLGGLVVTAAFAAWTVGKLNLISVAFAVLYIGLGIDFSVHYCLRYRELLLQQPGLSPAGALRTAAGDVGASLIICALTTSIGFYAFVPTQFTGVSELGLISGTGMFISLAANLLLLPALLNLLPAPRSRRAAADLQGPGSPANPGAVTGGGATRLPLPQRFPRFVLAAAVVMGAAATASLSLVRFDPNPLNLRDQASRSVTAYLDLLAEPATSPLMLSVIVEDMAAAQRTVARAGELPLVESSRSLASFVPENQDERLALVEELGFIVGLDLTAAQADTLNPSQYRQALDALAQALQRLEAIPDRNRVEARAALRSLRRFQEGLAALDEARALARLRTLETTLLAGFGPQLERLSTALSPTPVTLDSLPEALRSRWVTPDGRQRVELVPAQNLADNDAMEAFVDEVRGVFPRATGLPVVQLGAGDAVVQAFLQAIVSALVLVSVLLLLLLRSAVATVQVMGPVVLASVLTAAATVLLRIDFNFANIIALPLLLGMGVDNGIHLVHRHHSAPPPSGNLLATSTARAVVFSALTTIVSFASLGVSEHPGTASMGILLAVGLGLILTTTLLVLPAILQLGPGSGRRARA